MAEMLVAVVVGLLVMVGLHQMFVTSLKSEATTSSQMEADRKAQVAMDDIAFWLRQSAPSIRYGIPAILEDADPQHPDRIHFSAPPDANLEPDPNAALRYWMESGAIRRGIGGNGYNGGVILAGDVSDLSFTFLRFDSGTLQLEPTSLAAETAAVKVRLTVRQGRVSSRLESTVRLRNMWSNR